MERTTFPAAPNPYSPVLRLLVIPLLVYLAWLLETFLLAGSSRLLQHPDPAGFAIYTVIGCILTGILLPVICIRKAFVTGAVNMFQIGFRDARRTIFVISLTAALVMGAVLLFNPSGTGRAAFAAAFLLLLPGATGAVMICWVLAGTHIQASVRGGGALVSITTGAVVTGILFAAWTLAANPAARGEGPLLVPLGIGLLAALFFFAVRDVYATILVVAAAGVFSGTATFDPRSVAGLSPLIAVISVLPVVAVVLVHLWLSRNYATILVPAGRSGPEKKDA